MSELTLIMLKSILNKQGNNMKLIILAVSAILLSACGGYFIPDEEQMYKKSMAKSKDTAQIEFTQGGFHKSFISVCLPYRGQFKYLHKKVLVSKGEKSKYSVEKVTANLPANELILVSTSASSTSGYTTRSCGRAQAVILEKGKKYTFNILNLGSQCGYLLKENGKKSVIKTTRNYVSCQKVPEDMAGYLLLNHKIDVCDTIEYTRKDTKGNTIKDEDKKAACDKIMTQKSIKEIDKIVKTIIN